MSTLESGPKLDWTRDNQMYERYRIWRKKVEFIFCSALADSTPKQLVSYLKYWMGDQGIPLIEKWESTGKLDYSNAKETPATEGGRRRTLSSGYKVQTYWDLLDEEFKPKGNKLLSIIELWTRSKQGDKPLNQWLTQVYNLVNICKYPEDSTDRIIRDVLIVGCNSNHARDKIIRQGEAVTLNEVIEILQTEESTHSTMQQIQSYDKKSTGSIYYQTYDSRSKKSKVSNEQNSSSSPTGSKKKCFRCGENFSRQHMKECRAQDVTCNGCGIKGHLKKCCKKSGNFPKDSNRQNNNPSSTGPGRMNIASTLPQTEADFFDEKGLPKQYIPQNQHTGSMYVLKKFQGNPNDILFSDNGVEIQHNTSTSVPGPDPTPDFPFQEFPLTEVVNQSQIDYYSISDTLDRRECSFSTKKAHMSTNSSLKSVQNWSSSGLINSTHEEMRENRDLTVHTIVEVRNPKFLMNRIPVLLLQVPRRNAFDVVKTSADNTWKNAGPRMSLAMVVALKVTSRNVVRSQVTSQKILINRIINLLPQVQAEWTLPVHYLRQKQISSMRKGFQNNTFHRTSIQAVCMY